MNLLYGLSNIIQTNFTNLTNRISNTTNQIFDRAIEKVVSLAKELPVHRDITNFTSDPVFWGKIFINNLESNFKDYENPKNKIAYKNKDLLFKHLNHYIRGSFEGTVLVNLKTVTDLILNKIATIQELNVQNEAQEFVFKVFGECQIQRLTQTGRVKQVGDSRFSLNSNPNGFSMDTGKLLILGVLLFPALAKAQGSCDDSISCRILRDDLNNRWAFEKNGLFDLKKALIWLRACWPHSNRCIFNSQMFPLDCSNTNLKNIDFSNIESYSSLGGIQFVGTKDSPCDLSGSKFENTSFGPMTLEYADFSESTAHNSSFNGGTITNSNFDFLEGNASFQNSKITNSSFVNMNGEFDFSDSKISNVDMGQKAPPDCPSVFQKSIKYRLTGAVVEKTNFTIQFPRYIKTAFNITSTIITERSPEKGSVFKGCIFDLEGYNNIKGNSCNGHATRIFNLTDTSLPDSIHNKPKSNSCSGTLVTYGGSFKNVTFFKNFQLPIEGDLSIGCSEISLNDVAACGHNQLRESNYKCLTDQCNNVEISNDTPPTLRQKFEDASILRNDTFSNGDLFSINKFLKFENLCPPNSTSCDLPEELSRFNCEKWNLKKIDFSDLNGNNVIIVPDNTGNLCALMGGIFNGTQFHNATFNNADLSDSKMNHAVFEESHFHSSRLNNLGGSATFSNNEITNTTFYNFQGNGSFPNSTIINSSFNAFTGNASFPNNTITGTSFDQVIGNFYFDSAYLANLTFSQTIYDQGSYIKSNEYHFTASTIDTSEFSVFYSGSWQSIINEVFTFVAKDAVFNACSFSQNNNYDCISKVVWIFNLTDTSLPSSSINAQNLGCWRSGAPVYYGGNLKNVTFPKGFQFPVYQSQYGDHNAGCTEFTLNNVTACDLPYPLSDSSKDCLTNACKDVKVIQDPKTIVDNFSNAIRIRNAFFLTAQGLFDVEKYFSSQDLCLKDNCVIRYPIFNSENVVLNELFWKNVFVNSSCFDQIDEIHFKNNSFLNSHFVIPLNNSFLENSTLDSTSLSSQTGSIFLSNSQTDNSTLLAPKGKIDFNESLINSSLAEANEIKMQNSEAKNSTMKVASAGLSKDLSLTGSITLNNSQAGNSTLLAPKGKIDLNESHIDSTIAEAKEIKIQHSVTKNSIIRMASGELRAKGGSSKGDSIQGNAIKILFKGTILDRVNWNVTSKKIHFLNSESINLQNVDQAEFRNITNLSLSANDTNPTWRLCNIQNLNVSLLNVSLAHSVFEGVFLSGNWTFGANESNQNLPNATSVRLQDLHLVSVKFCNTLVEWKVKNCLKNMGYEIGNNVQFSLYTTSMEPKTKKIILISVGASLALTIALMVNQIRKRRCPVETPTLIN